MLRCPWCNQSRWVSARFGKLAHQLEWLTGLTPYRCQACRRQGWHRAHRTAPSLAALRRQGPPLVSHVRKGQLALRKGVVHLTSRIGVGSYVRKSQVACRKATAYLAARVHIDPHASRGQLAFRKGMAYLTSRIRVDRVTIRIPANGYGSHLETDRLAAAIFKAGRTTTAWLVCAFGLGFGSGALLFSGSEPGVERANQRQAETAQPVAQVARAAPTEGSANARPMPPQAAAESAANPPVAPPSADAVPARLTTTPAANDARPAIATPAAAPPVASPANASNVQAAANSPRPERRRTSAPARSARRQPARQPSVAAHAAVPARRPARSTAPAGPRFHGSLVIRSEPMGAVVSVDGRVVGATPVKLEVVPAGSRVVRIESDGYERWSYAARVVANQVTQVVATLQRDPNQ